MDNPFFFMYDLGIASEFRVVGVSGFRVLFLSWFETLSPIIPSWYFGN